MSTKSSFTAKVFIENPAGQAIKNLYDEKTLRFKQSVEVSAPYPYAYGFFLNTTSGDGDNLDCFVLTNEQITQGQTIEVEPIGIMQVLEDGEIDHNIIAQKPGDSQKITNEVKEKLTSFVSSVFAHLPGKVMTIGDFLGKEDAIKTIEAMQDANLC